MSVSRRIPFHEVRSFVSIRADACIYNLKTQ